MWDCAGRFKRPDRRHRANAVRSQPPCSGRSRSGTTAPLRMRSGADSHPAVQQALRNHYFDSFGVPDSMSLPKPNPVELPWYEAVCQVVWRSGVAKHPRSRSWHRAAPRDYPSTGLLCEAELTKPDIIETAASDPKPTL
jgi:hypothetical protein